MEWHKFHAASNDDGRRLDAVVKRIQQDKGLSGLFSAIRKGLIRINEERASPSDRIHTGDTISIAAFLCGDTESLQADRRVTEAAHTPDIPVLYENDHIIALSKPAGVLVHDGPDSLEARIRPYLQSCAERSLSFRPGPLHRLDRNTSGVIIFSKSLSGAQWFSEVLKSRNVKKYYLAVLHGHISEDKLTTWSDTMHRSAGKSYVSALPGNSAVTRCMPIGSAQSYDRDESAAEVSFAALEIQTGRTHQIRLQASERGWPVYGDRKYGSTAATGHALFLHAAAIELPAWEHSQSVRITAPLPRRWHVNFRLVHEHIAAPRDTEGRKHWYQNLIDDISLRFNSP